MVAKIRIAAPEEIQGRERFIQYFEKAVVEADALLDSPCEFLLMTRQVNEPKINMAALASEETTRESILALVSSMGVDLIGDESLAKMPPDQRYVFTLVEGLRFLNEYVTAQYRGNAPQH